MKPNLKFSSQIYQKILWTSSNLSYYSCRKISTITFITNRNENVNRQNFRSENWNLISARGLKLWKEKTLKAMYWRKKSFDLIEEKLRARSEWRDWNYSAELFAFANRIQEPELDEETLTQAFTHQSFVLACENDRKNDGSENVQLNLIDNEEMINDGIDLALKFIPKYLRYHLQQAPEECIESLTEYLTSTSVLCETSKWIGCIDMVLCKEFPPSSATLSNTVFALIGAIKQKISIERAQNFIIDFILTNLNGRDLLEIWRIDQLDLDLNSFLCSIGLPKAEPRILSQSAIGTLESCYVVGIFSEKKLIGKSPGESLPIAKRMAELDAFRNLFGLNIERIKFTFGKDSYNLNLDAFKEKNNSILPNKEIQQYINR
ncbi:39S ribosomal protein L44 [Sarcoptes scabiei]|uniref:Large ribosomal subunit protein mL44 n=1 Tax=Sarcoptes scabiei TaxID=52283 RepID=A0A834R1E8_SARSC|nr:39S ribosomal protein L44 [Sarcoptes scabiei]